MKFSLVWFSVGVDTFQYYITYVSYIGNRVCSSWNALPFTITSYKTIPLFHDKLIHTKCINHVIVIPY